VQLPFAVVGSTIVICRLPKVIDVQFNDNRSMKAQYWPKECTDLRDALVDQVVRCSAALTTMIYAMV